MDTLHSPLSQFILILEQLSIDEPILVTGPGKPEKTCSNMKGRWFYTTECNMLWHNCKML